jgi:hypothetical protein
MPQRYKKEGLVIITAPLFGAKDLVLDSPEFEVVQGRQVDGVAHIGVKYHYKQGIVDHMLYVEYPTAFGDLSEEEQAVIASLITKANEKVLAMEQHEGAVAV